MRNLILLGVVLCISIQGAVSRADDQQGTSNIFQNGLSDRTEWESWLASLSGDYHDGALYWSAQRSLRKPDSCYGAGGRSLGDWTAGCLAAQEKLVLPDVMRKTLPDYKMGWNSYQSPSISSPATKLDESPKGGEPTEPAPVISTLPGVQGHLIAIVDDYAARFDQASNDMARGALRPQRAAAICRALPNLEVRGWPGNIETLSSTNDGKGVVGIRLGPHTFVTTWNTNFADSDYRTLIAPNSPLHQRLSAMEVGQAVVFDGSFFPHQDDCLRELSLTVKGAMRDPEFLFRFTDVRAAP